MINKNEFEKRKFVEALASMRESELARLLDMVETLVQDFNQVPLREGESLSAVKTAQKALKSWKAEVKLILKMKQLKDAAQLEEYSEM